MRNFIPHSSHEMTEWESTIVTLISTSRFGDIRKCKHCEAEHARTAAGEAHHDELEVKCPYAPEDPNMGFKVGDKVQKPSGKPFKSQQKINTIKGFTTNTHTSKPSATFMEDDSDVELFRLAKVIP